MRMRRPRPSTFVWRSFVDVRLGGGFLDGSAVSRPEEAAVDRVMMLRLDASAEMAKEE